MSLHKEFDDLLHYRNAYFLAFSATAGYICFGWSIGLINGVLVLPSFEHYFGLDIKSAAARASLSGNIVSIQQAGAFFGALVSTFFASRYGRKPSMLASAIIYVIGSVVQSIVGLGSTPAVGLKVLYFGRFFGGIGVGLISALVPTYVSECAPRAIRGRCTGSIEVCVGLGNMLSFWVNYGVAIQIPFGQIQWRLPMVVQIIPGVLFFLAMLFQPESPRWLVENERYEDAAKSLAYISRLDPSSSGVQSALFEIRTDFVGRLTIFQQFRKMGENKMIALRCIIPPVLVFFQQWSGTNAINSYSPSIFASLGISSTTTSLLATGIYGVVKWIGSCLVLAFVIESWGRKRTLFYGGMGQGLMMFWIGGYVALHSGRDIVPATYVSVLAIYLYGIFFSLGWGFTPLVLGSEIAPGHLRPAVMSLVGASTWLFTYVITQITPTMLDRITWGTYIVFGVASVVMAVLVWVGVPETTGVPLEDIKWLFEEELWIRCVQDAPGGRWILGKRRARSVEELKNRAEGVVVEGVRSGSNVSNEEMAPEKQEGPSPLEDAPIINN
ncbi:general substrate transporter [Chiua virens]|nr:general substrate transporter [Chiua virens]